MQSSHRQEKVTIFFEEGNLLYFSRIIVTFIVESLCVHLQEFECRLCLCLCPAALLREQRHAVGLGAFSLLQDPVLNALHTFQLGGQDLLLRLRTTDTSGRFLMTCVSLPIPSSPSFTEDFSSGIVGSLFKHSLF